jgi:hypothetical protein
MITWIPFGHLMTPGQHQKPQTSTIREPGNSRSSHLSATNRYSGPRISGFGILNSASQPNVDIEWRGADAQLDAGSAAPMPRWNEYPGGSSPTHSVPSTCPPWEVPAVSHGQSR